MGFANSPQYPFQGYLAGGNTAVAADFALGTGVRHRDGSLFFMDVESNVESRCRV